jgi:Cap4 dsDNA endonuclease
MSEQLSLEQLFDKVKPRENAGPISSDRSQYQKDWALCKLLKIHSEGLDYTIAFDIHDDVVVFVPEHTPGSVSFYQVKTKDGEHWTLKQLQSRRKGKKGLLGSILGNLYHNSTLFKAFTSRLTLVSNVPFRIGLSSDNEPELLTAEQTLFTALPEKVRSAIKKSIQTEAALNAEPELDSLLWFERSDLPLIAHDIFTRGKLSDFLDNMNPSLKYNIPVIYKTLIHEIRRRNDYSKPDLTFAQMRTFKGIGKSEFTDMIKIVAVDDRCERAWDQVSTTLTTEGVNFKSRQSLKRAWQKVETQRATFENAAFRRLMQVVSDLGVVERESLYTTVEASLSDLKAKFRDDISFDDDFLRAVLLMKIHGVL